MDIGYRIRFRKLEVDMLSNHLAIRLLWIERILLIIQRFWQHLVVLKSAAAKIEALTKLEGWGHYKAVQNNAVFLADADLFTQPVANVDGIELLAALFHPDLLFYIKAQIFVFFHFNEKEIMTDISKRYRIKNCSTHGTPHCCGDMKRKCWCNDFPPIFTH
jgi:hypothetical protein